jgi:hypothetical protein
VNLVFTVTLSQAVDADVTIDFATSNGTATAGSDYTATTGTVTFARPANATDPFITTQTISIPVIGDLDVEPNETLMVTLSNLEAEGLEDVGVFLTDAVGVGTITDDDATGPTLSISNGTAVTEGDSGTVNMVFTVTLTNPPAGPVQVSYQTVDGTATTLDLDYVNTFGVLTFTPGTAGATSQTITVPVLGDIELEADESFTLMLLNPNGGATIATPSGAGTITDDDEATISIADATVAEGTGAGTTTLDFTVTLSAAQTQDVTVVVNTSDGTATVAGNDYTAVVNQTVTIPAGQTSASASVTVTRDADVEANEMLTLTLTNPQIGGQTASGLTLADATATGTITNDDQAVAATVSIANASIVEGTGAGTTTLQLTVTLSSAQTQDVTVVANTTNGSATAGTDYTALVNQVITIPAGQTTATASIPITRDSDVEGDETLTVTLTDPQLGGATDPNITLGTATATGTITDDDATAAATLSIADVSIAEGTGAGTTTMTFTVSLSAVQNEDVTVTVNTSNGTATVADGDYTAVTSQTVTIPAGQTSATVDVTVAHDNKVELDETFLITLSNPLVDGVADPLTVGLGDAEATGTITNDDAATVSINDVSALEAMGDQTFTVTLSNPVDVDVTVAVSDGTASQNVTIPAGQLTTTAVVGVDDNEIVQFDFDYTVTLSNVQASGRNVTLGDATGAGTILDDDFADVTISDVSIVEGDSGTSNLVFTVTLTNPVEADVTMTFTTTDLTATAGSDYVAKTVTVSFLVPANPDDPLITTQTVSVVINGDTTLEPNETFRVTLSDLDAEGLEAAGIDAVAFASGEATQTATGTITNDDGGVLVSVADASLAENDANMEFVITLSEAAAQPVSVTVNTANGPLNGGATAGSDYTGISGLVVTFAPGETSKTVSVPVAGDNIVELDETLTLTLSNLVANGQQVVLNDAEATGTITNNDTATVSIADATVTEGNSGTVNLGFVVTLSGPVDAPVTMTFNTANGAGANGATAGSDYVAQTNVTVTFTPGGPLTQTVNVVVNGDTTIEPDELLTATLTALDAGGRSVTLADATATGTITNDDAATISISDVTQNEGNSGTTAFTFTITLSAAMTSAVSVTVNTADGTATVANSDYAAVTGQVVTFAAGETSKTITVNVTGDTVAEQNETFNVNLSGLSDGGQGVTISDAQGVGTITNDDGTPAALVSIANVTVNEGNSGTTTMTFTVTLTHSVDSAVTVTVNSTDVTATAGTDFAGVVNQTVTIPAGQTSAQFTVNVTGDLTVENDETFTLTLSNPLIGGVSDPARVALDTDNSDNIDNVATGQITNDDIARLSIADITQVEGTGSTPTAFTFTVTMSNPSDRAVTVTINTTDGTAIAGTDYAALAGQTVTIAAGQTSATVTVNVTADSVAEANETFTATLSNPLFGGVADTTRIALDTDNTDNIDNVATATITDDDGQSSLSGVVYMDANGNGVRDTGEVGLPGVQVTLRRTDVTGTPDVVMLTGNDGTFSFTNVPAGTYSIVEAQPGAFIDGTDVVGSQGGTLGNDTLSNIVLAGGQTGTNNNFGEVGLAPAFVTKRSFLGSTPDAATMLREMNARAAELAGNTALAASIRAGSSTVINATVSIGDASLSESNTGTTTMTFNVTLSAASDAPVSVTVNTADGTATIADNDYAAITNQVVTFAAGETTKAVTVTLTGDTKVEANETFNVNLSNLDAGGRNITISDASAIGTINNDDAATVSIGNATTTEGASGTTNATFTVTLSAAVDANVAVTVNTANGTATTADTDYDAITNQTITFTPGGALTQTVTVPVRGDNKVETNETYTVTLSNIQPNGRNVTIGTATGTGTITNDDAATISVADAQLVEGNSGTTSMVFTVTLSSPVDSAVTVNATTTDGTATAGSDYTAVNNQIITFNAGTTTATVSVPITGDTTTEPNETFTLTLGSITAGGRSVTLGDAAATGTIVNDDGSGAAQVSVSNVSVTEGTGTGTTSMTFTVTLSAAQTQPVTVTVNTSDGTATAGTDYTAQTNQTVTIPANQTSATFTVPVTQDSTAEANETLTLTLSNPLLGGVSTPASLVLGTATATGTINDDDSTASAQVSITNASILEGTDAGTTTLNFAVNLSAAQTQDVTVVINTANGTATLADNDYAALTAQTVTIPAGQTTVNASVTVTRDSKVEGDETLTATISDPKLNGQTVAGLTLGNATATGTITNDDNAPAANVSIANATIAEGTDAGTTTLNFTVTLSAVQPQDVTVVVNTANGSATVADSDYAALTAQTVTIPAGQTTAMAAVTITRDNKVEADETFTVTLTDPKLGGLTVGTLTLGTATATGTITNDDEATLTSQAVTQNEGNSGTSNAQFTVTLSNPSDQPVTVVVNTTDGTAAAGTDYTALTNQTITFNPGGAHTQSINVSINGDTTVVGNETINLNFSGFNNNGRENVTLPSTSVQGTINNDDQAAAAAVVASTAGRRSLMVGVGGSGDVTEESLDEKAVDSVFADDQSDEIADSGAKDDAMEDVLDWLTA